MLLHTEPLHFAYTSTPVLNGVALSLRAGETVALLGANGSGKSTLIRLLLGRLDRAAPIRWDDQPLGKIDRRTLAKTVAYLPQTPSFEPGQRVVDVLRLGRLPYAHAFGIESDADTAVVHSVAAQLNLIEVLDRTVDTLSGGQRQRVFVGRCLVQQPRALLLDEPNTFLDLKHQIDLCQLLSRLAKEQSLGILMAAHDVNLAAAYADRVVLLHEGRALHDGPVIGLSADALTTAYGVPVERHDNATNRPIFLPRY